MAQVFLNSEFTQLVCADGLITPVFQLFQIQAEHLCRQFTGTVTPSIGKQDTANIQKQTFDF